MISSIVSFMTAHQTVLVALVVAILDCVIAVNPNIQANGLFHFLYLAVKPDQKPQG